MLPYVYQGGVEQYGWLTGAQMMDGLALGETTPEIQINHGGYVGGLSGRCGKNRGDQSRLQRVLWELR